MARIRHALLPISMLLLLASCCTEEPSQTAEEAGGPKVVSIQNRVVDASCGQCQLGLPGIGCDLAVAFDGKAYYVDGSHIDDHGDAHAPTGMCNAIVQATVSGSVVDGRFLADEFAVVAPSGS